MTPTSDIPPPATSSGDADIIVHPEAAPLALGQSLTYASGNFGTGTFNAFNHYILPSFLSMLGASPIVINLLSSTSSVEGIVIQPAVGAWSDRSWHAWLGRRRWFIAIFAPITIAFLVLTPFFSAISHATGWLSAAGALPLIALGIFLFTLAHNLFYNPYSSLLADITPPNQRGRVNGLFHMLEAAGEVLMIVLGIVLIKRWGYSAMFPVVAASFLLSLIPLTILNPARSRRAQAEQMAAGGVE